MSVTITLAEPLAPQASSRVMGGGRGRSPVVCTPGGRTGKGYGRSRESPGRHDVVL